MLLQWPITLAFYYAIRRTPEIAADDFLWFSLGSTDMILPLIAAVLPLYWSVGGIFIIVQTTILNKMYTKPIAASKNLPTGVEDL